jgi:hypothetical protein
VEVEAGSSGAGATNFWNGAMIDRQNRWKCKLERSSPSSSMLPVGSTSACRAGSKSCPAVVVLNSSTKALTMSSHFSGLSFRTLLSSSCCKHDVPIRARVSFSDRHLNELDPSY